MLSSGASTESGLSTVRVFMMRQKRKINVAVSFVVIAALIIGLYTISSRPIKGESTKAQPIEQSLNVAKDAKSESKPVDDAARDLDTQNDSDDKKATISKKDFESADRAEWKTDQKVVEQQRLAEQKYEEETKKATSREKEDDKPAAADVVKKPPPTASPTIKASQDKDEPKKIKLIRKIPEVIIIGVHKCNTKFLADILHEHPQVSVAWGSDYFNSDSNYRKGTSWYLEHLPEVPKDRILVERSSRYYSSMAAAQRIKDLNPKTKIIFMACDPVKRAIGHYRSQKIDDDNLDPFEDLAIHPQKKNINEDHDFIVDSIYNKHIKAWLDYFPKDQLFILDDVSLMRDTDNQLRMVEDYLGVDHKVSNKQIYYNETRGTRCGHFEDGDVCFGTDRANRPPTKHEPIDPKVVAQLKNYFRTHNDEFFKQVGMKFEW